MILHLARLLLAVFSGAVLLGVFPTLPAAARPQADLDAPIDMELRDAELESTLHALASVAGVALDAPDDLESAVTVFFEKTPWRESVDRLCRIERLACSVSQGDTPTLHVRRSRGFVGLASPISLSLRGADLLQVLQSMDMIVGDDYGVVVDGSWEAKVSIEFHAIPWHLALEHTCDLAGCALAWSDDHVLVTQREIQWQSGASRLEELETHPQLVAFDDVAIVMHGDVVRDLPETDAIPELARHATYVEALDAFCEDAGCEWRLEWGDPAVLRIWPRGSSPDAARNANSPGSARLGTLPIRGLPPLALRVTVDGPAEDDLRSDEVELSWNHPRHSLGVLHGETGATFLHLAWIPFAPDRQVLLPLGLRCPRGRDGGGLEVFEPLALPLVEETSWSREIDGTKVAIQSLAPLAPLPPPVESTSSETTAGPGRRLMETLCSFPRVAVEVELVARSAETEPDAEPDAEPGGALRHQLLEGRVPGIYLLASPASGRADVEVPSLALVLLGTDESLRPRIAVIRPGGDGGVPSLKEIVLSGDVTHTEALGADHELRLRTLDDSAY